MKTLKDSLPVILSVTLCIALALAMAHYQAQNELKTLELLDFKQETNKAIKHYIDNEREQRELLERVVNSQLHEYTVIEDRYIIRVSIYDMQRIKGPMHVFDKVNRTHTVYYVNRNTAVRQPTFDELILKFNSTDY